MGMTSHASEHPINAGESLFSPAITRGDSVVESWVRHYTAPDSGNWVSDMEVLANGTTVFTGWAWGVGLYEDWITGSYDSDGNERWVQYHTPAIDSYERANALTVDQNDNIYVAGKLSSMTLDDFGVIKYGPDGAEHWWVLFDGAGFNDEAIDIAVDSDGNVYVTGTIQVFDIPNQYIRTDIATVKYSTTGQHMWDASYHSGDINDDRPTGITVDEAGNVYVTGYSTPPLAGNYGDFITIKYDAVGNEQWVDLFDGPVSGNDQANDIELDTGGNIYVTGYVDDTPSSSDADIALIKYTPDGTREWVEYYDRNGGWDEAEAMEVDDNGYIYLAGVGAPDDFATVKYDTDGTFYWSAFFDLPANSVDRAWDLAVDQEGNVYTLGDGWMPGGNDMATVKYDRNGMEEWSILFGDIEDFSHWPQTVGVDDEGNIYVASTTARNNGPGAVITIIKYEQIPSTSVDNGLPVVDETSLFIDCVPNPVRDHATLYVNNPERFEPTISVYDVAGKKIDAIGSDRIGHGQNALGINSSGIPAGAYWIVLKSGNQTRTRKVVFLQ